MATSGVTLTFSFSCFFAGLASLEDELEPSEPESSDPLLSLLSFFFEAAFLDPEFLRYLGFSADESESFESEELSLLAGAAFFFGATLALLSELSLSDELAAFFAAAFFFGGASEEESESLLDDSTTFFFFLISVDVFLFLLPAFDSDFSEALLALETFEPALVLLAGTFGASLLDDESEDDPESFLPLELSSESDFNSAAFFAASSIAFLAASIAALAFSFAFCFAAFLSTFYN